MPYRPVIMPDIDLLLCLTTILNTRLPTQTVMGRGGFGTVYSGVLGKKQVCVKHFHPEQKMVSIP